MRPKNEWSEFISPNLKLIRSLTGMSQQEFASKIGITKDQIQSYENDRSSPSTQTVIKICDIAGITPSQFMDRLIKKDEVVKEMFINLNRESMDTNEAQIIDLRKHVDLLVKTIEQQNRLIELQNGMIEKLKILSN